MRSAIIISALLSATALAHPTLQNIHLHKRQQGQLSKPQLDKVWKDSDGTVHETYKVIQHMQVGPNQQVQPQPEQEQQKAPEVSQKNTQHHDDGNNDNQEQHHGSYNKQVQQVQQPQKQEQPKVDQQPPQKQEQPKVENKQQTPTNPPKEQPKAEEQPSSGGNDLLGKVNSLRKVWDGSLSAYTWSDKLEKNALATCHGSEQGGTVQAHTLNPGSMGQCIAPGGESDISGALKMWMCEIPKGLSGQCGNSKRDLELVARSDPLGHAKIFGNAGYKSIGCAWCGPSSSKGLWTCDFE